MSWFMWLLACTSSEKENLAETCTIGVEQGQAEAEINGQMWTTSEALWSSAATGLNISLSESDGWRITMIAQQTVDNESAIEASYPMEIPLQTGEEGGSAILYVDTSNSERTEAGGFGSIWLESQSDDILQGCFEFDVPGNEVRNGQFVAQRL